MSVERGSAMTKLLIRLRLGLLMAYAALLMFLCLPLLWLAVCIRPPLTCFGRRCNRALLAMALCEEQLAKPKPSLPQSEATP